MAAKQSSMEQDGQAAPDDIPLASLEESLLSLEKLDRASPELWPEQMPGVSEFAPAQNPNQSPPAWSRGLTKEDVVVMQQLAALSTSGLIMEVKKLHDMAYQLGLEEAKEMTRGKYLNIFARRNR
ncbi:protein lin-52 homolog [Leguminivora glycinivorella]|uniref:protein lin-52 homolog n=1 Tax=Leguminivora glycinivorella TaxID=1035111 RepID=UPI00200CE991|nr:protein lin-52 homolog [Leguminivora glycinivorella]